MTDARSLTTALRGAWHGRYGLARCPAHGDQRPSLSIADGRDGRLLLRCFSGCDFRDVLATLRDMGLVEGRGPARVSDPEALARRAAEEAADRAKRTAQAQRLWAEAAPAVGTLAERYLRRRAIRGPIPASLRFAAECWHASARRLPAMVAAAVLDGEAEPVAVHRTYLADPGVKADADPVKAMLGTVTGAAARLADGPGPLVVAEGIETAFSVADALARHGPKVWAGLSAHGLASVRLPAEAGELVVAPDAGAAGWRAAEALADRAQAAGWRVRVLPPPAEGDWNDRARAAAEAAA